MGIKGCLVCADMNKNIQKIIINDFLFFEGCIYISLFIYLFFLSYYELSYLVIYNFFKPYSLFFKHNCTLSTFSKLTRKKKKKKTNPNILLEHFYFFIFINYTDIPFFWKN
jgi:hypothetical protein